MYDKIKIDENLHFGYEDLMCEVDFDHEFTLGDIIDCVNRSKIYSSLPELLQCPYLYEFLKEANGERKELDDDDEMEYLELYYSGEIYDDIEEDWSMHWSFHGVGKLGYVPEDSLKYQEWTEEEIVNHRQAFAIEMSPVNELCEYPVRINPSMTIGIWEGKDYTNKEYNTRPLMTLMGLLYTIFDELSFFGSPENRINQLEELKSRFEAFKEAKENGDLEIEGMKTHEEVLEQIKKKFNKE